MDDICLSTFQVATIESVLSSHRHLEGPMERFNATRTSHPSWTAQRSVQAIMNLVYLIKITPHDDLQIDLYLELAERELERLKDMLPQQFDQSRN